MPSKFQETLEYESRQQPELITTVMAEWLLEVHERIDGLERWANDFSRHFSLQHAFPPPKSDDA